MTDTGSGLGGLFGALITFGAGLWGVKKIGEALEPKRKKKKGKKVSFLDNTEPFK